jgi:hypothetical protein
MSKVLTVFEASLWKTVPTRMWVFGQPKFWNGCLPNFNLLAKWEHEIVLKQLPFFRLMRLDELLRTNKKVWILIFGWISLTRLKFSTSFYCSFKIVLGFFYYVLSWVTDLVCKHAHNVMSINDHSDNVSINITCLLWDTLCILEVSFWVLVFLRQKI